MIVVVSCAESLVGPAMTMMDHGSGAELLQGSSIIEFVPESLVNTTNRKLSPQCAQISQSVSQTMFSVAEWVLTVPCGRVIVLNAVK
jgi:hypothetical protein